MQAVIVRQHDPFVSSRRSVSVLRRKMRVATYVRNARVDEGRPFLCVYNGAPLLRKDWKHTTIKDGDIVAFVTLPQGGGGGSNPLQIVLMLAVVAVAGPAASALLGPGAGALALGFVKGAIVLGGAFLVNALIPPPKPPQARQIGDLAAPSPTYSLTAQGNQARIGQAIPSLYGRVKLYPDFAAQPYMEFAGNEQFLYSLLAISQGAVQINEIGIGETAIGSFQEVSYEVVQPGGSVTLFPTNVVSSVEVSGQEALQSVALGPFVASPSGTTSNFISIDVVCPKGLYYANDAGGIDARTVQWTVEARQIDDSGTPIGSYFTLGNETITEATNTPVRRSYRYSVATARYEVRFTRTNAKDASSRAGNDLNWFGLRSYLPGVQQYGNVTLLAVRMRATNQLSSQSARQIYVDATRKLPTRSGGAWTAAQTTQSIAWAIADIAKNTDYGGGLTDAQLDIAGLEALDTTWAGRGDKFNFVFDSVTGLWEALNIVARAGRAVPIFQGGVLRVVRDQAIALPTAIFSVRNIVPQSFQLRYSMVTNDTPDSVNVLYFDQTKWKETPVKAVLSGGTDNNPAEIRLVGSTDRNQSWREGIYAAAQNRWRRRFATFVTELEGNALLYGDLVAVQHDMPDWHQASDAIAWNAGSRTLTLADDMEWGVGTHWAALRKRDGSFEGPYVVTQGASANQIVFGVGEPATTPSVLATEERTQVIFTEEVGGQVFRYFRVLQVTPRQNKVEVTVVNEDARVHTADQSGSPPSDTTWALPPIPAKPVIPSELFVVTGGTFESPSLYVSWVAAAGADRYIVQYSVDNVAWTDVTTTDATSIIFGVQPGAAYVRVAPVGAQQGGWVVWSGTVQGNTTPPIPAAAPTGFVATAGLVTVILTWSALAGPTGYRHLELHYNSVNNLGTAKLLATVDPAATVYADDIGAGAITRYYWIRSVTKNGVQSSFAGPVSGTTADVEVADGSITETKIADNSISTPKLQTNSVTATKIAAGQVSADKMVTATITAASGIIADAAITTAKIADANVSTLKIAGNAVVLPVASYTVGVTTFGKPSGASNLIFRNSLVITVPAEAAAQPVEVSFGFGARFTDNCLPSVRGGGTPTTSGKWVMYPEIRRNGIVIYEPSNPNVPFYWDARPVPIYFYGGSLSGDPAVTLDDTNGKQNDQFLFSILDSPGQGSHTYEMHVRYDNQVNNTSSDNAVWNSILSCKVLKR